MTRTTLRILALLVAAAAAPALAALLGVAVWWTLPAVPAAWAVLTLGGRRLQAAWVRVRFHRDRRAARRTSVLRGMESAIALRRIAAGENAFSAEGAAARAVERALFFPSSPGDEAEVIRAIRSTDPLVLRRIAAGLVQAHDEAVAALTSPMHPLFLDAEPMLQAMGSPPPTFCGAIRSVRRWRRVRAGLDALRAAEVLALRLLQADMPHAALAALAGPKERRAGGKLRRVLRRLARLLVVVRQSERGNIEFRADRLGPWAAPITLVAGESLRDLVPGSPLVRAASGGAAALDRAVRGYPQFCRKLAATAAEHPWLAETVRDVLASSLRRDVRQVERALRKGTFEARPDRALSALLRGVALVEERRPREAVGEFEAALERAPGLTAAAYSLAVARRRTGSAPEAKAAFSVWVRQHGDDPEAHVLWARFLAEGGDLYGARRAYRDALRRFPASTHLHVAFAGDLASWGDGKGAAEQLDAARDRLPGDPRLALMAGRARLHAGRAKDAVEPLEQAAAALHGRERVEALFWLVSAFREQGRHERAVAVADDVLAGARRGHEEMLDQLAEYFEERHEFGRARLAEDRARKLRGGW